MKQKRGTSKSQFTRSEKRLNEALDKAEGIPLLTIERRYNELSEKWSAVQEAHDTYVAARQSEDGSIDTEVEEGWIDEIAERFDDIEIKADSILEELKRKSASALKLSTERSTKTEGTVSLPGQQGTAASTGEANPMPMLSTNTVQLERIKLEKFNGDIRKYPKFREQFELYIKPLCNESQLPFVLRSHLAEEVREEVDNVDDNLDTLWTRLDKKYGNCGKQVDAILADIAKAPRGDGNSTLKMINIVEKAYRDLARMGRESEMQNGTILSLIEKKLPEEMRFEWIKAIAEENDADAKGRFSLMLELLRKWRIMIEYDQAAIRRVPEKKVLSHYAASSTRGYKSEKEGCWIHTAEKHPIWVCQSFKAKPVSERLSLTKENKACHACLEINCPGARNVDSCKKNFKCPVDGCKEKHNKLLHQ